MTLGHHHKSFGSARIARTPRALELVGACPCLVALDPRWQRQQESRRGWGIDTRLAPGACSEVPERPRIDATISQRQPCGPGTAHRPGRHRTRLRAARWWPPRRGSRLPATLAPDGDASRSQQSDPSATATLGSRTVRPCAEWWLVTTPPHSSQVSHQRATLKPSTLGESGWASRVARASQMHTKCPGTRFGHFGAARETSPGRIATPRGKRRPMAHGGGCGILVCILRSLGRALYGSGRGRVPF